MKKIIIAAALLAVTGSAASAQVYNISEIQRNFTDGVVTVKGMADANEDITLRVTPKGILAEAPEEYYVLAETTANANGSFSYSFIPKDLASRAYELLVSTDKSENVKTEFFYGDDSDIQKTLEALKNAKSAEELEKILTNSDAAEGEQINHTGNLFLNNDVFNDVNKRNVAEKLNGYFEVSRTADEARSEIMSISLLECYNEGRKAIVADSKYNFLYDDITELSKIDSKYSVTVYSEYDKLNTNGKSNVIDKLMNKGFNTFSDLYKAFAEAVCVEGLKNYSSSGYGHVDSLLNKNSDYIGLDMSAYNKQSANMQNIISAYLVKNGSSISSKTDIENYIKKAIEENGTSSGGSGGTSSGGTSGAVLNPIPATQPTQQKTISYSDLSTSHWAYDAIVAVSKREIFSGDANGNFRPNDFITREEFIKVVVNTFGIYNKNAKCSFSDTPQDSWYAAYVASVVDAGIVNGISDDKFGTGAYITREDAAVILSRAVAYAGKSFESKSETEFTDSENISDYAKNHVTDMANAGIINGMTDGSFSPKLNCTRAQAATVIYNIIKALKF